MTISSFANITATTLINEGQSLLHSVIILASAAGGDLTVYEGLDASSGRKVATVKGAANVSSQIRFSPPLLLARGLLVVIGSSITEATITWSPAAEG